MLENVRTLVNKKIKEASIPVVFAVALLIGILIGISLGTYQFPQDDVQLASKKYTSILNLIDRKYTDTVDVDQLFEGSVKHMLGELDPHSSYVANEDYITKSVLDSDFEGIGIRYFYLRDTLFVAESIKEGPSYMGGLRAGDRILSVAEEEGSQEPQDSSLIGIKDVNAIYNLLRGKSGSKIALTVFRKLSGDTLKLSITRGKIPNVAVDLAFMLDDKTGYIRFNRFSARSHLEVKSQMAKLLDENMGQLILDMRNNGGGYLNSAVEICDLFLESGRDILYTVNRGKVISIKKAEKKGGYEKLPLIVLLNENSASASEIVAGALQDNDRALIVGRRSYGKGLVQTPFTLLDDSELRLTTSRYHTPSGRCIQKPYTSENYSYQDDYISRIKSGELFNEEFVKKDDSLKYHTLNKRTVYGGGGIYPDVFVAEDTSQNSILLRKLYSEQIFTEFGILYGKQHEKSLDGFTLSKFVKQFKVDDSLLNKCLTFAQEYGISVDESDLIKSTEKIKLEIKAHIAESKWGVLGMYSVLNEEDSFIKKSIEAFPTVSSKLKPVL